MADHNGKGGTMIRLGPVTIMRSSTHDAYRDAVIAAWRVHMWIWSYGEDNAWPDGLRQLPALDATLSEALSYTPPEDALS